MFSGATCRDGCDDGWICAYYGETVVSIIAMEIKVAKIRCRVEYTACYPCSFKVVLLAPYRESNETYLYHLTRDDAEKFIQDHGYELVK